MNAAQNPGPMATILQVEKWKSRINQVGPETEALEALAEDGEQITVSEVDGVVQVQIDDLTFTQAEDGMWDLLEGRFGNAVTRITGLVGNGENEIGIGFARKYRGQVIYEAERGNWYIFDEYWRVDRIGAVDLMMQREVMATRRDLEQGDRTARTAMNKSSFVRGSLNAARIQSHIAKSLDLLDADPWVLGVPGGYVDLKTGKLHPPDPDKLITMITKVAPSKNGDCPKWKAYLKEAHAGQPDVIGQLQKVAGYILSGERREEVFAYFVGDGGNGKSVFTGTMLAILDQYAAVAQAGTFTMPSKGSGNRGHMQNLAKLRGKRMVIAAEPDEDERWDLGRVKEWTGGNMITANLMYKNGETFMPEGFLIMEANVWLEASRVDAALSRRLRLFPFPNKPKKIDTKLKDVLFREEAAEILRWALDGLAMVVRDGLGNCETVEKASMSYLMDQDVIGRFIDECLEGNEAWKTGERLTDIEDLYDAWARNNDQKSRPRYLGKKLEEKGLVKGATNGRAFIRQVTFTGSGMALMSDVLRGRIEMKETKRLNPDRWADQLKLIAKDGEWEFLSRNGVKFDD